MKKRFLAMFLALVMCLALVPMSALAAEEFEVKDGVLGKYNGPGGDVVIPDGVTNIWAFVFAGRTDLTSVTIPNGVTSIGNCAFEGCSSLVEVNIPDSVTDLYPSAFGACSSLTSVTIPVSITLFETNDIEGWAFQDCTNLKDIYYRGTEAQWNAIEICFFGVDESFADYFQLTHPTATIHYNSAGPALTAQPTNDKLSVDGQDATPAAYKIGGANFFMLRDVAMLLNGTKAQFEISYDNDKKAINITTGKAYTPQGYELKTTPQPNATAEASTDAVYIDGEKVELTAYKIGGANFYGIRDLGRALGFNVDWTRERGMFIESDKPYSGT